MPPHELKKIIYAKIEEIPTLPVVIAKLLAVLEDPKSDAASLAELISRDPALTAKTLKVANSAYYGFPHEIASVNRAVALIGFKMIKALALSIGVMQNLPETQDSALLSRRGLWRHSVAVATLMKELGRKVCQNGDEEYLFVAGLLHDVGKIVLLHFFYDDYQEALEKANRQEDRPLYFFEREVVGMDHGEVGALLLTRWKFPPEVVGPILAHHRRDERHEGKINSRDLALLRLADALPQEAGLDIDEAYLQTPVVAPEDLELLRMAEKDYKEMLEYTSANEDKINAFFSALV